MPHYSFECAACKREFDVWLIIAERNSPQQHCGVEAKRIMSAAMVAPLFESYRAMGRGQPWIRTKTEHKDYLRQNNYEEVGNDPSMAPPKVSDEEFRHQQSTQLSEIRESFQTGWAAEQSLK